MKELKELARRLVRRALGHFFDVGTAGKVPARLARHLGDRAGEGAALVAAVASAFRRLRGLGRVVLTGGLFGTVFRLEFVNTPFSQIK